MKARETIFPKVQKFFSSISQAYLVKEAKKNGIDGRLVASLDSESVIAEQYNALVSKLFFLPDRTKVKTILITSCQPKEGKTITACNLALTLAKQFQRNTVLVDVDLRRPSIHSMFGLSRRHGVSDFIYNNASLDSVLDKPKVDGLTIVTAGANHETSSNLINAAAFEPLLQALSERFEFVILDAPPVLNVTYPTLLGGYCDAVLFVVKAAVTPQTMVEEAFALLRDTKAMPAACILTNAKTMPEYYSYFVNKHYRTYYQNRYVPYGMLPQEQHSNDEKNSEDS